MTTISVKLDDDLLEDVDGRADEEHDGNRSDAVRDLLEKGLDHDQLKAERDDLERQLMAANRRIDTSNEIVEWVEEERSLRERRRTIEERRAHASIVQLAKWRLFGMPTEDVEAAEHK